MFFKTWIVIFPLTILLSACTASSQKNRLLLQQDFRTPPTKEAHLLLLPKTVVTKEVATLRSRRVATAKIKTTEAKISKAVLGNYPPYHRFKCSEITQEQARGLLKAGHTYLDRDKDQKPCESS